MSQRRDPARDCCVRFGEVISTYVGVSFLVVRAFARGFVFRINFDECYAVFALVERFVEARRSKIEKYDDSYAVFELLAQIWLKFCLAWLGLASLGLASLGLAWLGTQSLGRLGKQSVNSRDIHQNRHQ